MQKLSRHAAFFMHFFELFDHDCRHIEHEAKEKAAKGGFLRWEFVMVGTRLASEATP